MSTTGPRPGPTADDNDRPGRASAPARPGIVLLFSGAAPAPLTRAWPAPDRPLTLGRGDGIGVLTDDDRASRAHAEVAYTGGRFTVRDLGSRNGTFVGGRRLAGPEAVTGERMLVRIGQSLLWLIPDVGPFLDDPSPVQREDGFVIGPALRQVLTRVARAGQLGDPLLVHGESGSGKELIARRYHAASPRAGGPFVAVNSAAIPEALAERLLFGAVRGAYSGATSDAPGYLQVAHGGTLFLDELGELSPAVQAKLLRVIETQEVTPVGGTRPIPTAFGLVTATHRDMRAAIADGQFRADFYYRVARIRLALPPLRQRIEEIPWLVADELRALGAPPPSVRLIEACCLGAWPGNLRELRSEIRSAAAQARAEGCELVTPEHLSETAGRTPPAESADGRTVVPDTSRRGVEEALATTGGNVAAAARALGLHRNQLYRLMERHGIERTTADAD
jgi:hypothetical protein